MAAIQKRLSEAVENVQKATVEQKRVLALPPLPERKPSRQASPALALPDLMENPNRSTHGESLCR
jgi:hypothetical protein